MFASLILNYATHVSTVHVSVEGRRAPAMPLPKTPPPAVRICPTFAGQSVFLPLHLGGLCFSRALGAAHVAHRGLVPVYYWIILRYNHCSCGSIYALKLPEYRTAYACNIRSRSCQILAAGSASGKRQNPQRAVRSPVRASLTFSPDRHCCV